MVNSMTEEVCNNFTQITGVKQQDILEAIKVCLSTIHKDITPRQSLKVIVYHILKAYFLDGKRFVIAECPTGSGKTIIGFITYFCIQYIIARQEGSTKKIARQLTEENIAYFLTSNKVLQEQISNDIKRFDFDDYMMLLKGVNNYKCIEAHNRWKVGDVSICKKIQNRFGDNVPKDYEVTYEFRPCASYSGKRLSEKFSNCVNICPYKVAREEASSKACTVLNYAYFLNVMRLVDLNPNTYFPRRLLTICDEAHLIPDIVCDMFNFELTDYKVKQIYKMCDYIVQNFGNRQSMNDKESVFTGIISFFNSPLNQASAIIKYIDRLKNLIDWLKKVQKDYNAESFNMMYGSDIKEHIEALELITSRRDTLYELIYKRSEDLFFESEQTNYQFGIKTYKHIIKDLRESDLIRNNMLDKMNYGLFMSATLGDMDEYAQLIGMKPDEYTALFLPSTFDFSKSPIYITKSGWLNYKNFDIEIQKVLGDCLRICNAHPTEKGLIHTSTFKVTNLLREKLLQTGNKILIQRFLFYQNTKEKESLIEQFKNSDLPYILVGPSLYEGIDLPDYKCRFQILVKAPYAQINSYVKKKMKRYPFWYKRNCMEKIVQAIGRSNRHKDDWSVIYLLDNCFDQIIFDAGSPIVDRLEYRKIY